MKIKMKTCASAKDFLYSSGVVYEVGKDLTQKMADSFVEVGFAVVEEVPHKEEIPKKTTRKTKVKTDEN